LSGSLVVFDKLVAVGTENKRDVVQFADAIVFALLQTMFCGKPFVLGFNYGERNRLTTFSQWAA